MKKLLLISSILCSAFFAYAQNQNQLLNSSLTDKGNPPSNSCFIFGTVILQQNVKCYGGNTGLTTPLLVFAFGSTGPYTFTWSPSATNFAQDSIDAAVNLTAGTYTVSITNALGCTGTVIVNVTQPPKLTLTTSASTNDICNGGNNGSAAVLAGGGVPSYTFSWSPAVSTTHSASNLTAGNYIVTVTDSNNCKTKDTITITQPVAITTTATVAPSACTVSNGSVSILASNGVIPYTYSWSPSGNTTTSISGLGLGNYTCTVIDAHGCHLNTTAIVSDSTTLNSSLTTSSNVKCNGQNNGFAICSVVGGLGHHDTYLWSPSGNTTTSISGLIAGNYTFTATDSVGCKALTLVTITQPGQLRDSMIHIRNIACYGTNTGRVTVGVAGGTSPFTYAWSSGASTAALTGLTAGSYTVKVTDSNGCLDSANITLTQPATAVADSNKVTSISCYGYKANATVYAYGGVHPYTYAWAPGGNTTNSITGLAAGTYIVTIRDSNACRLRDTIVITQPPSFIVANDTLLSFPCSSKAWVQLSGTLSNYSFAWSPSGGSKDTATSLCAGVYEVTITNSTTGCVQIDTIKIINSAGIQEYAFDENIIIYPVPAKDQINISISNGNNFVPQTLMVFDITGRELMTQKINGNTNFLTLDISKLPEGTYFMRFTNNKSKVVKFSVAGK